jgi:hypothetical protein
VVFILTSARHHRAARPDAAMTMTALLRPQAMHLSAKQECLFALDLWAREPTLSFPDSLAVAYSALRGHEVATFDRQPIDTPGVRAYAFEAGTER